jgi:Tol biopolymer transport system component
MSDSIRLGATALAIIALSFAQLACGGAGDGNPGVTNPPPKTPTLGSLVVLLEPRGNGRDADGFSATLDASPARALTYDAAAVSFDSLSSGDHTVRIAGIAPQCSASTDSVTHTVKAGATDTVAVGMTCLGGFAYIYDTDSITTEIAYLTEDGRTIQLTSGPDLKFIYSWSPDGTRLLYEQITNNQFHIGSVRADGTDQKILAFGAGNEFTPRWSPDGTHIAFVKGDSTGIYVAISDPDGANEHALAGTSPLDIDPTWSADGSRLYFGCYRYGRLYDLCTAALDGSDLRSIRSTTLEPIVTPCAPGCAGAMTHFAASPDGSKIAFLLQDSGPSQHIWAASPDGTGAISLSGNTPSYDARWSPSGDRMLLTITDGGPGYALATVKADGSSYRQIVSYADSISAGSWSPDGTVIAYDDDKTRQIGVMNADGSSRRLITYQGLPKYTPTWNPKARAVGALSADRARPASPRVEQLPVLSGLRAQILRGRLHPRP